MSPAKHPLFSVIIPTYHRNNLLAKCLDWLVPGMQSLSFDNYEVVVSDDGFQTTAGTMSQESYSWAKWVESPRKGIGANRNNGTYHAQGEWLVFTDDDCLPESDWLLAFLKQTTDTALALEGLVYPVGNIHQDLAECPVNLDGNRFWGANICIKNELFEKVGSFDPKYRLWGHDDVELKLRLSPLTGISFVPDARVGRTVRTMTLGSSIRRIPDRAKSLAYHIVKQKYELGFKGSFGIVSHLYILHTKSFIKSLLESYLLKVSLICSFYYLEPL